MIFGNRDRLKFIGLAKKLKAASEEPVVITDYSCEPPKVDIRTRVVKTNRYGWEEFLVEVERKENAIGGESITVWREIESYIDENEAIARALFVSTPPKPPQTIATYLNGVKVKE